MSERSLVCPRCSSFIGKVDNLTVCPVCGYDLNNPVYSDDDSEIGEV